MKSARGKRCPVLPTTRSSQRTRAATKSAASFHPFAIIRESGSPEIFYVPFLSACNADPFPRNRRKLSTCGLEKAQRRVYLHSRKHPLLGIDAPSRIVFRDNRSIRGQRMTAVQLKRLLHVLLFTRAAIRHRLKSQRRQNADHVSDMSTSLRTREQGSHLRRKSRRNAQARQFSVVGRNLFA